MPDVGDLKSLVDSVREDGLAMVVVGPERREPLDRVQAFMAVLEGYAEHVMDAVGAQVLDDLPALRAALQRRRRDRSGLLRLLERLIGMDLKLRQYEQGKAFCDGVVARGGHRRASTASGTGPRRCPRAGARRPRGLARAHRAARLRRAVVSRTCVRIVTKSGPDLRLVHVACDWVPATKSGTPL